MIEILSCGALTTVQDLGRPGHRRLGIGTGGAMDSLALRVANRLLGNVDEAAGIEITASAFRARFTAETTFAVCGSEAAAELGRTVIPPWWIHRACAGDELAIASPKVGLRTYLAIRGGIAVPEILGSRSTDIKGGFGGHEGRSLQAGDRLAWYPADPIALPQRGFGARPPALALASPGTGDPTVTTVRAIPAAQYETFSAEMRATFWKTEWILRPDSNRLGLRLAGPDLIPTCHQELLSHGIIPGVIQVPAGGQPIVQMCDANTAGGYPKMAVVIAADLWRLAQVRLNGKIRFMEVSHTEAVDATAQIETYLRKIQSTMRLVCGSR